MPGPCGLGGLGPPRPRRLGPLAVAVSAPLSASGARLVKRERGVIRPQTRPAQVAHEAPRDTSAQPDPLCSVPSFLRGTRPLLSREDRASGERVMRRPHRPDTGSPARGPRMSHLKGRSLRGKGTVPSPGVHESHWAGEVGARQGEGAPVR